MPGDNEIQKGNDNTPATSEGDSSPFSYLIGTQKDSAPLFDRLTDTLQQLPLSGKQFDSTGNLEQFTTADQRTFKKNPGDDNSWTMSRKDKDGNDVSRKVENLKYDGKSLSYDIQRKDSTVRVTESVSGNSVTEVPNARNRPADLGSRAADRYDGSGPQIPSELSNRTAEDRARMVNTTKGEGKIQGGKGYATDGDNSPKGSTTSDNSSVPRDKAILPIPAPNKTSPQK